MILKKIRFFVTYVLTIIYLMIQYIVLFYLKNYTMLILLLSGHAMKLSWGKTA